MCGMGSNAENISCDIQKIFYKYVRIISEYSGNLDSEYRYLHSQKHVLEIF